MEAELNKRERVCCLIIAELSFFLLLCQLWQFWQIQVHVSQTTLRCAICLSYLIRCQSIPSTQIFHLRGLCCFAYYLYWLKNHSFCIQLHWESHVALYVLSADRFIGYFDAFSKILEHFESMKEMLFLLLLMCLKLWIHVPSVYLLCAQFFI